MDVPDVVVPDLNRLVDVVGLGEVDHRQVGVAILLAGGAAYGTVLVVGFAELPSELLAPLLELLDRSAAVGDEAVPSKRIWQI